MRHEWPWSTANLRGGFWARYRSGVGRYYKLKDGSRVQVVGIVEDGKYGTLAEEARPAMFLPSTQVPPSSDVTLVVRSDRDPQQLADAVSGAVRGLDAGLPFTIRTWKQELEGALFPSRMATLALGVFGMMGAVLSITASLEWRLIRSVSGCGS